MKTTSFKIGFIGAGKVGVTLAKYFSERNVCVSGLYDKNYRDAAWASRFISAQCFSTAQIQWSTLTAYLRTSAAGGGYDRSTL